MCAGGTSPPLDPNPEEGLGVRISTLGLFSQSHWEQPLEHTERVRASWELL